MCTLYMNKNKSLVNQSWYDKYCNDPKFLDIQIGQKVQIQIGLLFYLHHLDGSHYGRASKFEF